MRVTIVCALVLAAVGSASAAEGTWHLLRPKKVAAKSTGRKTATKTTAAKKYTVRKVASAKVTLSASSSSTALTDSNKCFHSVPQSGKVSLVVKKGTNHFDVTQPWTPNLKTATLSSASPQNPIQTATHSVYEFDCSNPGHSSYNSGLCQVARIDLTVGNCCDGVDPALGLDVLELSHPVPEYTVGGTSRWIKTPITCHNTHGYTGTVLVNDVAAEINWCVGSAAACMPPSTSGGGSTTVGSTSVGLGSPSSGGGGGTVSLGRRRRLLQGATTAT